MKTHSKLRGFSISSLAYYLSAEIIGSKKEILLLAPDDEKAKELYSDLSFFLKDVDYLPSWDVLPFDLLSPSNQISSVRNSCLYRLSNSDVKILITSATCLMQKVLKPESILNIAKKIALGDKFDREDFCYLLLSLGYTKSSLVEDVGQFLSLIHI